jgi:glycosyltransferase involved in cell wall biosynthesis
MQKLAHTLNLPRTSFDGALMGASKWKAYRDASVYALPTQFENFGMTVAESLSMGTPVIVTRSAPWQGLETNHCGWWIDAGVEACADALNQAMRTPLDELRQMGDRGRAWMASSFAWDSIVERMRSVYDWVLNGMPLASRPSCVRLPRH